MKKVIGIVIAILLALGIGGFGGYYYSNNIKKDDTKKEESSKQEETKVESLDVTDPIIEETLNKMSGLSCSTISYDYLVRKDELKVDDIPNEDAIWLISGLTVGTEASKEKYSEEEITKNIQAILGKDYKFEHKNYKNSGFEYDKDKKQYTVIISTWGCTVGPHAPDLDRVTKAVVKGNTLTITYKVLFGQSDLPDSGKSPYYAKYYKDYAKKQQVPQKSIQFIPEPEKNAVVEPSIEIYYADSEVADNYNLGSTYEFTFEKQDNEYVFVKSQKMK